MVVARVALVTWLGSLCAGVAHPQGVSRLQSVDSSGKAGNDSSGSDFNDGDRGVSISADGRFCAFASKATDLVAGDTNGQWDVFVHDDVTGVTERVSVSSSGTEADADCNRPGISADGRIVVFESRATNLVAGDTNGVEDVFVHDRSTGTTDRVDVASSGSPATQGALDPALSADGRVVAFTSISDDLVPGDTNSAFDVFVHDLVSGVTERVSVDSAGTEGNDHSALRPALSADGGVVAFGSLASNLVAGDTNGMVDVFVHDRGTGLTERVDVDSNGNESHGRIFSGPSLSGDGRLVAFHDDAADLVAGDTNNTQDVFVRDRSAGVTERVSVASTGVQSNGHSFDPVISADSRFVAFVSSATNLVPGDKNHAWDVFVHDRVGGFTDCVSVASDGLPADWDSRVPAIDGDGEIVAFSTRAVKLTGGAHGWQVYARERCNAVASWTNYGAGLAGSFGVPAFTSQAFPAIGTTLALDLANSSGVFTAAALFFGTQRATLHTSLGGDLLLLPITSLLFVLPPVGVTFTGDIPRDDSFCGLVVDFQALELDAGALKGVSFTQGLELAIGR
jgi:Tol biopolymer transport system component